MATSDLTDADLAFLRDRLDSGHIKEVAKHVRAQFALGNAVEACYQPGDLTWYALMFVPKWGPVVGAAGGGTAGQAPTRWFTGDVLIVYGQRGTMVDASVGQDPEYLALKLTDNKASAVAIAELLREVLADG